MPAQPDHVSQASSFTPLSLLSLSHVAALKMTKAMTRQRRDSLTLEEGYTRASHSREYRRVCFRASRFRAMPDREWRATNAALYRTLPPPGRNKEIIYLPAYSNASYLSLLHCTLMIAEAASLFAYYGITRPRA